MRAAAAWQTLGWLRWPVAYALILGAASLVGWLSFGVGNAIFLAGALVILSSIGFVGIGSDSRFKLVRNMIGFPVALEKVDPEKRRHEISTGMKVFLLGIALWAPLLGLTFR